jgi:hypothetical protein
MTEEKKMKIEFAPGCFDNFDGTQEELDEMVSEIQKIFGDKTGEEIKAMSRVLDEEDLDDLPEDVIEQLINSFNQNQGRTLQ